MKEHKIATIGSHSALQILKGAKDEGFSTIAVCEKNRATPYKSFRVADKIIEVSSFRDFLDVEDELIGESAIIIPHATGIFKNPDDIDVPSIVKFYGAKGGKGFFLAKSGEEFERKIAEHKGKAYIVQEYIIGVPVYIHYFYSPLTGEVEIMSFDRRFESNVDSIGRIAAKDQLDMGLDTSYNITGNSPLVVRESLLPKAFEMGEAVIAASKKLEPKGIFGPFSLETVITPELQFYVFEISARIVAGTNPYITGSPYTALRYNEPMSTGRRISREIKNAIAQGRLSEVLG
ncbi:formate--phosphoribosylaminoimidazolecarboxamide ligase [Candidatus Woesearchaeota archaeon]|nr:formate--phosphoribosylaminoimidazolecarboxamide ligase [Candidatus Woesearchaeota archaeon]